MAGSFPEDVRYTEADEWVRREGEELVCGVTSFAAEQLGDGVYVQLPEVGAHFGEGDSFGEIESVKAVSDLYSPVAGEINAINEALDASPGLVNDDPYGKGWMLRLRPDSAEAYDLLLDAAAYERSTAERH